MLRVLLRATPVGNGSWQPDCASRHQRLCEMRFVMGAHLACACAELSTCQSGWTLPLFWSPTLGSVHEAGTVDASAVLDARFSFGARGRDRWCIAGTVDAHPCALRLGPSMALTRPHNAHPVPALHGICLGWVSGNTKPIQHKIPHVLSSCYKVVITQYSSKQISNEQPRSPVRQPGFPRQAGSA